MPRGLQWFLRSIRVIPRIRRALSAAGLGGCHFRLDQVLAWARRFPPRPTSCVWDRRLPGVHGKLDELHPSPQSANRRLRPGPPRL